jgi:hypothetical protein
MKLIIVDRAKVDTYIRLREQFADDPDVKVVFERRKGRRNTTAAAAARRLRKSLEGRDYIVVYTADDDAPDKRKQFLVG